MKTFDYFDNIVANELLLEQQASKRRTDLQNTLSASILGYPLQYQILHIIGVPKKDNDTYVLRKFERGHQGEAWLKSKMKNHGLYGRTELEEFKKTHPAIVDIDEEDQAVIDHLGVTGHIDAIVDHEKWDHDELKTHGIFPHEIKTITNADYNRNFGPRAYHKPEAKHSHVLQGAFYAMALGKKVFFVDYAASDDYRMASFLYEVAEVEDEVRQIIREAKEQLAIGKVPLFVARENWQTKPEYYAYPTWMNMGEDEMEERLKTEYPEAYKRLQSFVRN